jgi:SAM-dependent methyltransferase
MCADTWNSGARYESYVGRWSRMIAREFIPWLAIPAAKRWLDVSCGTGALTQTILDLAEPDAVAGVDPSEGFLAHARATITSPRARFLVGDARALPMESESCDALVSGLALNFVPDTARAAAEMARVARPGGTVAVYVWDYSGEMQFMRYFWDAAAAVDPNARELDEGPRFPICHPDALDRLFSEARLCDVTTRAIDIATTFRDFDDYWTPFLGGQGAAPSYLMSLDEQQRVAIRERLRVMVPAAADGSISLVARAWAARGSR